MKFKALFFLLIFAMTVSCTKEDNPLKNLLPRYQPIIGDWKPLTMSYDSVDVRITRPIEYDRLEIKNNLSYKIYPDKGNPPIEDGTLTIISQSENKLELLFHAVYPPYSSYAGSHIFGSSNVVLDDLTKDQLLFKSTGNSYYPNMEFRFRKY